MTSMTPSEVHFLQVAEATGRHVCYMATFADVVEQVSDAWRREPDLTVTRVQFDDPDGEVVSATRAWLFTRERNGERPLVMVGSTEHGDWVDWKLQDIPIPPIPGH